MVKRQIKIYGYRFPQNTFRNIYIKNIAINVFYKNISSNTSKALYYLKKIELSFVVTQKEKLK